MQTQWKSILDPLLGNTLNGVSILPNVQLNNGTTVINHLLQRVQQGWFLVDNIANAVIWRAAAFTTTTITLEASANTTISIWVY